MRSEEVGGVGGLLAPVGRGANGHLLFRRDRAAREREQRAEGLARPANAQGGHHRPRGVKKGCLFGGVAVVCFFLCDIVHVGWGSFCFEVEGREVPPLHCTAPVMTLFLF